MNIQIRRIRKSQGLTQKELADKVGATIRQIGYWEAGNISLDDACSIADVLGCTLDELAGREVPRAAFSDPRQDAINSAYAHMDERARGDLHRIALSLDGTQRPSNAATA